MIEIIEADSSDCPVIRCDACHRPITGRWRGIVTWKAGSAAQVFFWHKGACDPRSEELSMELDVFLELLVRNSS